MATLHRFFFALRPPPAARALIAGIRNDVTDPRGRVADDRLHLTLAVSAHHPSYPAEVVAQMRSIGDRVKASPAPVLLDRIAASPHSIALRPSHRLRLLHDLADALAAPLGRERLIRPGWRFSPHVTLGYRDGAPRVRPIASIAWTADNFVLIHSLVGETRHELLGRWPLDPIQGELL